MRATALTIVATLALLAPGGRENAPPLNPGSCPRFWDKIHKLPPEYLMQLRHGGRLPQPAPAPPPPATHDLPSEALAQPSKPVDEPPPPTPAPVTVVSADTTSNGATEGSASPLDSGKPIEFVWQVGLPTDKPYVVPEPDEDSDEDCDDDTDYDVPKDGHEAAPVPEAGPSFRSVSSALRTTIGSALFSLIGKRTADGAQ